MFGAIFFTLCGIVLTVTVKAVAAFGEKLVEAIKAKAKAVEAEVKDEVAKLKAEVAKLREKL